MCTNTSAMRSAELRSVPRRRALAGYGARPTEQRIVRQDRIWTAAGVSVGIDLALTLVAELHGPVVAQAVQLGIEYDPQPPFDPGSPSKAGPDLVALVRAVESSQTDPLDRPA